MPNYTLCLLLRAGLTEEDREKFLQELEKTLSNSTKAEVFGWGRRDLAYPVKKETQAFYYFLNFEADGTMPGNLDKKLKLADPVLRFLIVRSLKPKKIVKEVKVEKEKVETGKIQPKRKVQAGKKTEKKRKTKTVKKTSKKVKKHRR